MTVFRGTFLDTPVSPFAGGSLRSELDGGIRVVEGVIVERGSFEPIRARHQRDEVIDLRGGLVVPGFVDTHVHFPQVRVIGTLGLPLLDWLERSALPEEAKLVDTAYAQEVASDFLDGLTAAGTTTALVFGSHYAAAVDALFTEAAVRGLRITSGLVVSDRILREDLLTTPALAYDEALALARRWHRVGRIRYAVTPRFSLSCTDDMLDSCTSLLRDIDGAMFTSHLNEDLAEITAVRELFKGCDDYLDTYHRHALVTSRSVYAHNVHATSAELQLLGSQGASVAHCPTSNAALGSGLFPLREHIKHGVNVALGSDVGGGTGFSLLKEGLQAYFIQQLLADGLPLTSAHLLYLATASGASALGLADQVGDFEVGKQFDAVWIRPTAGSTLEVGLRHAEGPEDSLAKVFAMGGVADVSSVWVGGDQLMQNECDVPRLISRRHVHRH